MGTRPLTDAEMDELTLIKAEAEEDARWKAIQKGPYPSRELKESTEAPTEPPTDLHCTCTNECSRRCVCRKRGSGCSSACNCGSVACQNQLNNLPFLFDIDPDLDNPLRATPCFTRYLAEHHGPDLTRVDTERLRCKLMGVPQGVFNIPPDASEAFDERYHPDFMSEWAKDWNAGIGTAQGENGLVQRDRHVRALLRHGLTTGRPNPVGGDKWYYSFCRGLWMTEWDTWHCTRCHECAPRETWHCQCCKKCIWYSKKEQPCEVCGGVSDEYNELAAQGYIPPDDCTLENDPWRRGSDPDDVWGDE